MLKQVVLEQRQKRGEGAKHRFLGKNLKGRERRKHLGDCLAYLRNIQEASVTRAEQNKGKELEQRAECKGQVIR